VQENLLERQFHDALFPKQIFRAEVMPQVWPAGVGDQMVFSARGLMPVNLAPTRPGDEIPPSTYPMEQWRAQLNQYNGSIDTDLPTSMVAIADLFLSNTHVLGMQAAQTLNRKVRNRYYNAAEAGWTVADGAQSGANVLRVKRLNGFTTARSGLTTNASQVRFEPVSSSNPLPIKILDTTGAATEVSRWVIGFTPDTSGDELGPGTLTLATTAGVAGAPANVTVASRAYVLADDRTELVNVGGGYRTDDISSSDLPTLSDIRDAITQFRNNNVPEYADGRFHGHFDPVSESKIFADQEWQRILTACPDYYAYRQFAIGELLGMICVRNTECPQVSTVGDRTGTTWTGATPGPYCDDFAPELYSNGTAAGTPIHRILLTGQGGLVEYYTDYGALLTEAGMTGKVGDPRITNNGIEVFSDRIQLIIRAPLNKTQDRVTTTWRFLGDWPVRTDAATGSAARTKRVKTIRHGC
jgi:hypothetical protein